MALVSEPTVVPAPPRPRFLHGFEWSSLSRILFISANSQARNADTFGVLMLTLKPSGYDWEFVPEAGKSFTDTGSGTCH